LLKAWESTGLRPIDLALNPFLRLLFCLIYVKASRVSRLQLCQEVLMRRLALGSLLSFACFAYARQQQIPQQQIPQQQIPQQQIPQQQIPGDVYESGANAGTPAQAVQKLYELAAEMSGDPSSGYDAQTGHWPEADAAWQQWDNSMGSNGNALTQQQRQVLTACATHLNSAIGDAERSYLIQKSQPNNSAAQADAQKLLGTARTEFEQCNLADALNGSNGNPAPGANSPGSQTGGTPGSGSNPPIQGGVSTGSNGTPASGTPGTTLGSGPGTPPATGTQPGSPASPSSGPGSGSPSTPSASIQPTQDFRNKLLADAQTLLRNAGDISKAMSDRMNPATHNDVGAQVGLLSLAGAAGSMMGFAAKEFQLLAAASRIVQPASTYLQIADTAASQSTNLANQVAQAERLMGSAGQGAAGAAAGDVPTYLADTVPYGEEAQAALPPQGDLPLCGVLACARLSQLLGRNTQIMEILEKIKPRIMVSPTAADPYDISGGMNGTELMAALKKVGINSQIGEGIANLRQAVGAGNPVIASVLAELKEGSPVHALVVEGLETRGTVQGLKIYDPMGWVYWQPVETFERFFQGGFLKPH
jgi:hypothetical protein